MIDLHVHILPGIDDGPQSMADALTLARAAAAAGTTLVVATPHVSARFPNGAADIARRADELAGELARAAIGVTVRPGAEVALDIVGDLDDDELTALHLAGGPFLMVECPLSPSASDIEPAIGALAKRGHRILLAHPERSPTLQRDRGQLERLVVSGALVSVTATALRGDFGRQAQREGERLLAAGLVHNVVSDAHDVAGRPPGLPGELTRPGGILADPGLARWLTIEAPEAILAGQPLPAAPRMPSPPAPGIGARLRALLGGASRA